MNPRQFLIWGGIVLAALRVIGVLGIFGDGSPLWLTTGENVAHLVLGTVALAAVYLPGLNTALAPFYRSIVAAVGILALFFGIYGFIVAGNPPLNTFGLAQLNNPVDNILHLVVAAWAIYAMRPGATAA